MAHIDHSARLVLTGSVLISVGLGSVHGFSVFLEPLEARFHANRGPISLTYSFALVAITVAVLFGPRLYGRIRAPALAVLVGVLAVAGVILAGVAPNLVWLWIGYSLVFGLANGLGYGFGLQFAAQAIPGREGLAMGVVTAAYALGAVLAPFGFEHALVAGGFPFAMNLLAGVLIGLCALGAVLFARSRQGFEAQARGATITNKMSVLPIWMAYGSAVLAGLMTIGHAAGIAAALAPRAPLWLAPAVLAVSNLTGSLFAGGLVDRFPARRVLAALSVLSMLFLVLLAGGSGGALVFCGLAGVGFAYGGTIAAYPAAIAKQVGPDAGPTIYGRVFTAWGAAGLVGPWLAGALYDATGGYSLALLLAAGLALASSLLAGRLFTKPAP